jgi:hypothetical protein
MSPLCPSLYQSLELHFGRVLIANEGERLYSHPSTDPRTGRRWTRVDYPGEQYRVDCPRCNDTKGRLYIGHRFAEFNHLAICHNENCYSSPQARRQLYLLLFRTRSPVSPAVRAGKGAGRASCPTAVPQLPGEVVPLADLPPDHPAVAYVSERGFDPTGLSREYGIGFCTKASPGFKTAEGRLIIPVTIGGKLVGWQARFVGERNWKACPVPKYWTMPGMAVKNTLYNWDRAQVAGFGVLVEGVTDVWSVGPHAFAAFGKSISVAQYHRIEAGFRDRPLVVLLDGDASRETTAIVRWLSDRRPSGVVRVTLPDGRDPADFAAGELDAMIRVEAERQGVHLPPPGVPQSGRGRPEETSEK